MLLREEKKKNQFCEYTVFVVVDAVGLETDFTLETNRKRVNENY